MNGKKEMIDILKNISQSINDYIQIVTYAQRNLIKDMQFYLNKLNVLIMDLYDKDDSDRGG